jgi:mRNA-degrading endonuclease toxin of MazEF toxin-antitoxin module
MNSPRVTKGDVVPVDIPYLDATQAVKRPALVVSDSTQLLDVVVAGITSRIRIPLPPAHYVVDRRHADWTASGLRLDSAVRCDRLFTVEHASIHRVLGRLSTDTLSQIDVLLKRVMGMK